MIFIGIANYIGRVVKKGIKLLTYSYFPNNSSNVAITSNVTTDDIFIINEDNNLTFNGIEVDAIFTDENTVKIYE